MEKFSVMIERLGEILSGLLSEVPFLRLFLFLLLCSFVFGFFLPIAAGICLICAIICFMGLIAKLLFIVYGSAAGTDGFTFGRLFLFGLICGGIFTLLSVGVVAYVCFVIAGISLLISVFQLFFR